MSVRVGINGFGRVGRCAFRSAFESGAPVEWAGINDVADVATLAHLLRHDTVYGPFPAEIEVADDALVVAGMWIPVFAETSPAAIPWDRVSADVVLECTGKYRGREEAAGHLEAGAEKVVISAPGKGVDATVVLGVNFDTYDPDRAQRHLQRFLHDELSRASRESPPRGPRDPSRDDDDDSRVHRGPEAGRPAAQGPAPRARRRGQHRADVHRCREGDRACHPRARRQAAGIRSTRAGSHRLDGRSDGGGGAADVCGRGECAVREQRQPGELSGILEYSEEPLVSSDVIKSPYSSVFDAGLTSVSGGTQVTVIAWYDNEWGYSTRLVELAQRVFAPVAYAV